MYICVYIYIYIYIYIYVHIIALQEAALRGAEAHLVERILVRSHTSHNKNNNNNNA